MKMMSENQADWQEAEKRYQKALASKGAAETAYETARAGLNTQDLEKRAREKSLKKISDEA